MEMNSANVEAVVKQVLESMLEKKVPEAAPAQKAAGNEIPKTAHVAMLTALEHFEIKEYPMPEDVVFVEQTLTNSRETHSALFL